ncbi:hypothetical protein [Halomonas sp. BN3-1]|uniref:hypothetical protein n=1 Tax=Halomonas sp. BN3-1 TaxID=2082393 RepID=UPI000D3B1EC9|nr:hypothetical protein [Halomonas sp. BN3-1]
MFTIKIAPESDSVTLEAAQRDVTLVQCGETDYEALTKDLDQSGLPRVILCFVEPDGTLCRRFIHAKDRAWIMNANGKTVASV